VATRRKAGGNAARVCHPGIAVVDGVEMLVQLAMQLFESWTGVTPEEDVLQRAVSAALGE